MATVGAVTLPAKLPLAMIQRIQSVFLFLASLCSFGLFTTDVAETKVNVSGASVFADAHLTIFDSPLLLGGAIGAGVVTLIAIFVFGNRRLQSILCKIAVFLTLAYVAYGGLLWSSDPGASTAEVEPGIALPILTIVFAILAARYIGKDEKLVRSADRLR